MRAVRRSTLPLLIGTLWCATSNLRVCLFQTHGAKQLYSLHDSEEIQRSGERWAHLWQTSSTDCPTCRRAVRIPTQSEQAEPSVHISLMLGVRCRCVSTRRGIFPLSIFAVSFSLPGWLKKTWTISAPASPPKTLPSYRCYSHSTRLRLKVKVRLFHKSWNHFSAVIPTTDLIPTVGPQAIADASLNSIRYLSRNPFISWTEALEMQMTDTTVYSMAYFSPFLVSWESFRLQAFICYVIF